MKNTNELELTEDDRLEILNKQAQAEIERLNTSNFRRNFK